jgi:hypothetical protein
MMMLRSCLARSKPGFSQTVGRNRSRSRFQFGLVATLLCLAGTPRGANAADAVRYTGTMTIPIDLFTQEGTKIEKRKYEIEVTSDGSHWTLSFLLEGKDRVVVKGNVPVGDPFTLPAVVPVVGTHYLRSSAERLKTAQERQFSKTGLPQYAEQERDWKATVRVYKSSGESGEVFFIFQVRDAGGQLVRADFKFRSDAGGEKR